MSLKLNLQTNEVREILIISLSNLGDVILTTPVMSTLREYYPKAFISVVIGPKAEFLLRGSQTLDKVIIYDKKAPFGEKIKFIMELRKRPYDLVIDLRNTAIPYLVKTRKKNQGYVKPNTISMRERHLSRLDFLQIPEQKIRFNFFTELEARSAREKLFRNGVSWEGGFIVIAPGAGNFFKRWPISHFRDAAEYFILRGKQVIVVGSEEEKALGEQMKQDSGKPVNLCGALSLRELAAILHDADLVLCCDSGIMHLANELNSPVVSLFGPSDEKKYAKFGPHNRVIRPATGNSMEAIPIQEVTKACEELLGAQTH